MTNKNQTLETNVDFAIRAFNETLNEITFSNIRKREVGIIKEQL